MIGVLSVNICYKKAMSSYKAAYRLVFDKFMKSKKEHLQITEKLHVYVLH